MKTKILLLLLICGIGFTSCYSPHQVSAYEPGAQQQMMIPDDDDMAMKLEGRRVVLNASLSLKVASIDTTLDELVAIAMKHDGYVVVSNFNQTVIRIRAGAFKEAIAEVKALGELVDQQLSGQDVTDKFFDLETRLANAEKTRERYLTLLQEVTNIDEGIRIERELERLNNTIDLLKGQLKQLQHLESYATLTIKHQAIEPEEEFKPGIVSYIGIGLYKGVRWLFVRS